MSSPPSQSRTLLFVCLVTFLDALGVGLILPVTPDLIQNLTSLPSSSAAEIAGYLMFAFAGMQFFTAPILGGLSDQFGRRPVMLLALFGFGINYLLMAIAPNLVWLFVARALSGLCGGTIPAANATIVDITDHAGRSRLFGLTGAALGLGFILGPPIGGLLGEFDHRMPFLVAACATFAVFAYGYFAFAETLPPERRRVFSWSRANPIGSVVQISHYPAVFSILIAFFCVQLASQSYGTIWAFYTMDVAEWSKWEVGVSAGVYGLLMVLMQGGLTGIVIKRLGEWRTVWFSIGASIVSFTVLGFAGSAAAIYFGIVIGSLAGFFFPAGQSLMTKSIPENAQGELQGALASSFCVAAIISPILMSHLFARFTDGSGVHFPGAPFLAAAVLMVIAGGVLISRRAHH